jgi:cell division septal protein FtsQ
MVVALVDTVVGTQLSEVSFAQLREQIMAIPYVASVSVYQKTSDRLGVMVRERVPVAYCLGANGEVSYVDDCGTVLPHRRMTESRCLPVVRDIAHKDLAAEDIARLAEVVRLLPEHVGPQLATYVSEIILDAAHDEILVVTDNARWRLPLGTTPEITSALRNVSALLASNASAAMRNHNVEIDVRWVGQVVLRHRSRLEPVA